jgi:hypothetical protein
MRIADGSLADQPKKRVRLRMKHRGIAEMDFARAHIGNERVAKKQEYAMDEESNTSGETGEVTTSEASPITEAEKTGTSTMSENVTDNGLSNSDDDEEEKEDDGRNFDGLPEADPRSPPTVRTVA